MALFKVLQASTTSTLGKWEANKLHPSAQVDETTKCELFHGTMSARLVRESKLNPFHPFLSEVLPFNLYHNYKNILIHEMDQMLQDDLLGEMLQHQIEYHSHHMVIASFVGSKIPMHHVAN
jgi:hypothetical protein